VGGGVRIGLLDTVPAPGDYGDGEICGMMIGRGSRNPAPVPLCPPQIPYALPGREPEPPRWGASDKPGFIHVGYVVDKVALGQVFSEYFGFPCQSSFHQYLHNHCHLSSWVGTIGQ
jgi:hypothetical protein